MKRRSHSENRRRHRLPPLINKAYGPIEDAVRQGMHPKLRYLLSGHEAARTPPCGNALWTGVNLDETSCTYNTLDKWSNWQTVLLCCLKTHTYPITATTYGKKPWTLTINEISPIQPPNFPPQTIVCATRMVKDVFHVGKDISMLNRLLIMGALASLETLTLYNNSIGDPGLRSLSEALVKGALPQLKELVLPYNSIGDQGLASLADACAKGALAQLTMLQLGNNEIGDEGLKALSEKLAMGALMSLKTLYLYDNHRIGETAKKAMLDVARARGFAVHF